MKKLKQVFITLGIASGMTAAALAYVHNTKTCRSLVLADLKATAEFSNELAAYTGTQDFLTTLTREK